MHAKCHAGSAVPGAFLDAHALQAATSLAQMIRERAWRDLKMRVSVGVAHNKLLAKLASAAAKPDGVHVVAGEAAAAELLQKAPVSRMPGTAPQIRRS
jgi:DNA polymerase IV